MTKKSNSSEELLARAYALSNDKETKALYRDWASTYDETMLDGLSYLTPSKTAELLADAVEDKTARILDVGSGTGLAGENLAELGFSNIDALDYSADMLGIAAARMQNEKPIYQNCLKVDLNQLLEFESNTYDAIICTGLFTHAHVGCWMSAGTVQNIKTQQFFRNNGS
ncbi:Methyltransferase-like protein 27 [Nymphon striatum]|nr:Methyltransferase-like protein 27 [Nymphon striatum]